jgi:hypothetical protein
VNWWNWPDDRIGKALPRILSPDIEAFLAYAEREGAILSTTASAQS